VLELSRLVLITNTKNAASILISKSLKQLKTKPTVIVSYADCNEGHIGYVYQATNWIYTGQGNPEPWWLHPETKLIVSKTRRHIDKKAKRLGLEWTNLIKQKRKGKHRYVTFVGNRNDRRVMEDQLRYKIYEYPKGETKRFQFIHDDQ
jgi:hypothetical protein